MKNGTAMKIFRVKQLEWETHSWGLLSEVFYGTYSISEGSCEFWAPRQRTVRFPGIHSFNECQRICQQHFEQQVIGKFLDDGDSAIVSDLSTLVRRLSRALGKNDPQNKLVEQANWYIERKGLGGSILR